MARKINEQTGFPEYNLGDMKGVFSNALSNFNWGGPLRDMIFKGGSEGEAQADISLREFAKTFDPTSTDDVKKMQSMLGVKVDGILGPKTFKALRQLQGKSIDEPEYGASEAADFTDSIEAGLMSPEEADMLGVDYANTGFSEEVDMDLMSESAEDFIKRKDPSYMSGPSTTPEMYGMSPEEAYQQAAFESTQRRLPRESLLPYLMQDPVYAETAQPVVNTAVFEKAMKNMSPGLGTTFSIDREMPMGELGAYQGVSPYDERFMETPKDARAKLLKLVQDALRVSGR